MCGNFGLLMLGVPPPATGAPTGLPGAEPEETQRYKRVTDPSDDPFNATIHAVSRLNGVRLAGDPSWAAQQRASNQNNNSWGKSSHGGLGGKSSHGGLGGKSSHGGLGGKSSHGGVGGKSSHGAWSQMKSSHGKYAIVVGGADNSENTDDIVRDYMLPPLRILESQTSATEVRGGQAGGYSSIESKPVRNAAAAGEDINAVMPSTIATSPSYTPSNCRVRLVARKRHPLAADLAKLYQKTNGNPDGKSTITIIGHTRFATSSVNIVPELHPHEWIPFHNENFWFFNAETGKYLKINQYTGIHITHNGDFDAMEAYSSTMVVDEVGLWLERVLHVPNNTRGDSPKVCGMMEVLRVQGRWAASARLAWVRAVLTTSTDVSGGLPLSKTAPNTFPAPAYWAKWEAEVLEPIWVRHVHSVIKVIQPNVVDNRKGFRYYIDKKGVKELVKAIVAAVLSPTGLPTHAPTPAASAIPQAIPKAKPTETPAFMEEDDIEMGGGPPKSEVKPQAPEPVPVASRGGAVPPIASSLGVAGWSERQLVSFVHCAVRGFLKGDLYNCLTELLSRAEGSFGLQMHCTMEPGVVVIASKGQPMSMSFHPFVPVCLFASEAEALAVPVDPDGRWLPERIDLDSKGEIIRIGHPRPLIEGTYSKDGGQKHCSVVLTELQKFLKENKEVASRFGRIRAPPACPVKPGAFADSSSARIFESNMFSLELACGIEIRSYSLVSKEESSLVEILSRAVPIISAPVPYDPSVDLVGQDIAVTPAVLATIDSVWSNPKTLESVAARSLSEHLVACMKRRVAQNSDTIDLLIAGVEISMWVGEQWAADLRSYFPQLNVSTVSANKLLGLGSDSAGKVFFPGADSILPRRIDKHTCVLLISQSGQTFGTLHATRKFADITTDRLWLMTGCFNSKMENAMVDGYKNKGLVYKRDRVFNNYSGNRPAEPASVAVAAIWHTLTRLLLAIIDTTSELCPQSVLKTQWKYINSARTIQKFFRLVVLGGKRRRQFRAERRARLALADAAHPESKEDEKSAEEGRVKGRDLDFGVSPSNVKVDDHHSHDVVHAESKKDSGKGHGGGGGGHGHENKSSRKNAALLLLTAGCVADIKSLMEATVIPNISDIVGRDVDNEEIESETHQKLVKQGEAWAVHINETWSVLVLSCAYIILSVGLNLPIFGLLADAVQAIIHAGDNSLGVGHIGFNPRVPSALYKQGLEWTLVGLAIQFADAIWFVFLGKMMTWWYRWITGRPMWARHGKRTIVIVDTPCVHQLLENYVSKLYSQGYSFCMPDVHGASGLDHFVHRFTHRVVRGVLIAVGRPDGRLCCLAKSESAILLAVKQAAFIRNPDYEGESSGPEFITVGHNPFKPNIGLSHHIVLGAAKGTNVDGTPKGRRKFVDEYLYERLCQAAKPFSAAILRSLCRQVTALENKKQSLVAEDTGKGNMARELATLKTKILSLLEQERPMIPYGTHHIDPTVGKDSSANPFLAEFVAVTLLPQLDKLKAAIGGGSQGKKKVNPGRRTPAAAKAAAAAEAAAAKAAKEAQAITLAAAQAAISNDPASRLAFATRLDSATQLIQDSQMLVQHFYECRIASLERYMAFCVMFHAMADKSRHPWLHPGWDIARSQSNLRIATTASPISAADSQGGHEMSKEAKQMTREFCEKLLKVHVNF